MKKICTRCLFDDSDVSILFNDKGVCSYCLDVEKNISRYRFSEDEEKNNLDKLRRKIKKFQKSEYDSILGLSGGVDSSYIAYLAYKNGLNPLCIHFDNGWNSEIAVNNINKIIEKTGFDLHTYVINWLEFRDLQKAFLKAGVVDIEMLTDHAIFASLFMLRRKFKINIILSGTNYLTEHALPMSWIWPKMDACNIKAIHKRFGKVKLKSYPMMSNFSWLLKSRFGIGGVFLEPLNCINYKKIKSMELLKEFFNWEYYGGKHYESTFTKFYQAYILPTKFGIDKRKSHYSALIRSGEMTRDQALLEMEKPLYNEADLRVDKQFVCKKLGLDENEFDSMMKQQPVSHDFYATDQSYMKPLVKFGKILFGKWSR